MATVRCLRCDAAQPADGRFCTGCGSPLRPTESSPSPSSAVDDGHRVVACHACGATNAASRRRCGRCGVVLDAEPAPAGAGPAPDGVPPAGVASDDPPDPQEEPRSGSPIVFAGVIIFSALALAAVVVTILSASGVGVFVRPGAPTAPADVAVPVSSVRASSVRSLSAQGTSDPANLIDGDPTTAWREAASGDGTGEWIELQLEGNPRIERLLLWNGDQGPGRYPGSTRASEVRIDLGDRSFSADLLDVDGAQAVDLPEAVQASSVRITITAVRSRPGGDPAAAISEIEVRGPESNPTDVDAA